MLRLYSLYDTQMVGKKREDISMNPIQGLSPRLNYQRKFASGKIVNIGCGEDPAEFGDEAVHVDMDRYTHKNFVQANAHDLPFKQDEFDTAVLGDILEHSPDPAQMLREAGRVAKKVVATIYEEWRHEGMSQDEKVQAMHDELKKMGFNSLREQFDALPKHKEMCTEIVPDDVLPHHPHIQNFTDESLRKAIDDAGLEIEIFTKFPEGEHEGRTTYNWLLVGHRK
jgi:hypothetical protein